MIRFLGNIEAKADAKGRVFIPAQFRRQLQAGSEDKLIMRKDVFQDCLVLYPEEVWNEELNELRQRLNKWNANHQLIFRQFVSDVEIITIDGNGRILIPKRYLQIAGIQSDVRFIGVDSKIEIWAKERTEIALYAPRCIWCSPGGNYERRTVNNEQRGKMKEEETTYHVPVLLKESVDAMNITPDGTYVDVTFGGGGHSREILSHLGNGGRLLGFDQDEDANVTL